MDAITLNHLMTLQDTGTLGSTLQSSSASGQVFAALLSDQLSGDGTADASPADAADEAVKKKEMIMSLCMMMCGGSGSSPAMMSLYSALSGGMSIDADSSLLSSSLYSLMGLSNESGASSAAGREILSQAMTRLGDPYSTTYRGTGNYVDCSSLVQWAYKQAGISLPGTSVKQAQYCYDNGMTISKEELQPGDLIFWSNTESTEGRWRQIHHVAIYAGNGKVVEAKGSAGGVVLDDIWGENGGKWKIAMYARPYALGSTANSAE
jgi:hypothetical protein